MTEEDLRRAIEAGSTITVRYFGGTTSGAIRDVIPISIRDGKVRALCPESGTTKTFNVEKMVLATDGEESALPMPPVQMIYQSIAGLVAAEMGKLQSRGWAVLHDETSISLHRTFKNGKLIKTPVVSLRFEAMTWDDVFDGEEVIRTNERPRTRPWSLQAKGESARAFSDFRKAQLAFLGFAEKLAPDLASSGDC